MSPGKRGCCWMRTPFTQVPFELPASLTTQLPFSAEKRAWRRRCVPAGRAVAGVGGDGAGAGACRRVSGLAAELADARAAWDRDLRPPGTGRSVEVGQRDGVDGPLHPGRSRLFEVGERDAP